MTPISSDGVILHPLLPPLKGHSTFSLLGDGETPERCTELHLFLGLCPVDRFPNAPDHFLYKLAMARLRPVGFRYAEIQRVCTLSENTLRKWARVLRCGSAGSSRVRLRRIEAEQRALDDVGKQLSETLENESRLQALIEEHYLYPDTSRKAVMDMGRLLARNAFYQLIEGFRPIYDNRRDDHDILRSLVTAPGNIHIRHRTILVELLPAPRYTDAARKAIDAFPAIQSARLTDWFRRAGGDADHAVVVRVKS